MGRDGFKLRNQSIENKIGGGRVEGGLEGTVYDLIRGEYFSLITTCKPVEDAWAKGSVASIAEVG